MLWVSQALASRDKITFYARGPLFIHCLECWLWLRLCLLSFLARSNIDMTNAPPILLHSLFSVCSFVEQRRTSMRWVCVGGWGGGGKRADSCACNIIQGKLGEGFVLMLSYLRVTGGHRNPSRSRKRHAFTISRIMHSDGQLFCAFIYSW